MGEESDQRKATGIFTYVNPKDAIQKNYNKEALDLLENKKAQLTLESQAVGSGFPGLRHCTYLEPWHGLRP